MFFRLPTDCRMFGESFGVRWEKKKRNIHFDTTQQVVLAFL